MQLIAVYGSLRKGFFNHKILEGAQFLGTDSVEGIMYWNGKYPKLYHPNGDNNERSNEHVVEIYNLPDSLFDSINRVEIGAGYIPEVFPTQWGDATMWWMPQEHFNAGDEWIASYQTTKN